MRFLALPLAIALLAAGCINAADPAAPAALDGAKAVLALPQGLELHSGGHLAGLSYLHNPTTQEMRVAFPEGVLVVSEEGRLLPPEGAVALAADATLQYLPPYGLETLDVSVEVAGETVALPLALAEGERLVSGELAVELLKVQRDRFPHRTPGHENYAKSMAYFAEFFEGLGYEVEINEYGGPKVPVGPQPGPESLSSVVAYKRGTATPERYLVFGGHFDVVEQTTEGAFDNTAGTVATMAVAAAFRNVTTEHTLVFGLWGGEEDGILGSQAWISAHPELVPSIDAYVNFDVTGIAWPAPAIDPAPIVVAAGPDGPTANALHAHAKAIEETYLRSGAQFVYEGVAQGQATGAGVNAQSDHTPFMTRGIPVYFQFTQRVDDIFVLIHKETDTLENMTKYALKGPEGVGAEFTPEEMLEGERVLARSFETQMALGFYYALLVDNGVLPADSASSSSALKLV